MSRGTHDSTSQRGLLHIPGQAQLVILIEIRNNPCRSLKRIVHKMFCVSEIFQSNERKNQKSFRIFRKFKSFKFYHMHSVSCFLI